MCKCEHCGSKIDCGDPACQKTIPWCLKCSTLVVPISLPGNANITAEGDFFVSTSHYNLTDNHVDVPGQCLWNILRNHGVGDGILQAAAEKIGISVDDYVDQNQLNRLFDAINTQLTTCGLSTSLGYRLDVINYTNGDVVNGSKSFTYNTAANLVFNIGLFVDQDGTGHYVEDRNSPVGSVVVKSASKVGSKDLSKLPWRKYAPIVVHEAKRPKPDPSLTSSEVSARRGDSASLFNKQTFVEKERKAIKNQKRRVHEDPTFKDRKPKPIKNVKYEKIQRGEELETPFGSVYLKYSEFGGVTVYAKKESLENGDFELKFPWKYATIARHLDEYVLNCLHQKPPNIENPKKLIETILSFLNDELSLGETTVSLPFPKNTAAASLCGMLYYSEPSRIRDGGKWERTAMRMVLDNFNKAIDGSTSIKEVFAPIFTGDELDDLGNVPIFLMARSPHGFSNSRDVLRVGAYQMPQPSSASETALQKLTNVAEKAASFVSSDSDQES